MCGYRGELKQKNNGRCVTTRLVTELNMKQIKTIVTGAALMLVGIAVTNAATVFNEYAFRIDGTLTHKLYDPFVPVPPRVLTPIPGVVDYGTFDPDTGLGSLTISVSGLGLGLGLHDVRVFFDHDLGMLFDDETGSPSPFPNDLPGPGQTWEIDQPYFGDIYGNFKMGTLDRSVPGGGFDDMALAMGWSFTGDADILITLSQTAPGSGFYLRQYDADPGGEELFLSGVLTLTTPAPAGVPEGGATLTSLMCALFGLGALKYKVRR